MTVAELFALTELPVCGPVPWDTLPCERRAGLYVVALVPDPESECADTDVSNLAGEERKFWLNSQPVIYVGKTTRPLCVRVYEFYRHNYGQKSPHRGGQAVLLLQCTRWVYWSPLDDPSCVAEIESKMIRAFKDQARGNRPFANRKG